MTTSPIIQHKYGTAAQWAAASTYVLEISEIGVESDTHKIKVGDGTTTWADLPYIGETTTLTPAEQRTAFEIFNTQVSADSGDNRIPYAGKIFIANPAVVGSTGSGLDGASDGDIWLW